MSSSKYTSKRCPLLIKDALASQTIFLVVLRMATRNQKRKRESNPVPCTTGVLFRRSALPVAVEDGATVTLRGIKWQAQVVASGVVLTHVVSVSNRNEIAKARRLDLKNEIEQRVTEADALQAQRQVILAQLDQVSLSLSTPFSTCCCIPQLYVCVHWQITANTTFFARIPLSPILHPSPPSYIPLIEWWCGTRRRGDGRAVSSNHRQSASP